MIFSLPTIGDDAEDTETTGGVDLSAKYLVSEGYKQILTEVESSVESLKKKNNGNGVVVRSNIQLSYQASFFKQFGILCKRNFLNIFR